MARPADRMLPGWLAVSHPFPSALNGAAVAFLALIAGGTVVVALTLAVGMLGFQVSLGALNDLVDAEDDGRWQPHKPIPAGRVDAQLVRALVVAGGALGLALSAAFGALVLAVGAAGYAAGLAYDLTLRRRGLGWLAFAAALPLLLAWTWLAAAGTLPPGWPVVLPLAAVAGPALHLANALVDVERDRAAGTDTLAARLGRRRSWRLLVGLTTLLFGLAAVTLGLAADVPAAALAALGVAAALATLGVGLSASARVPVRDVGWMIQAVALAVLGAGWLAAAEALSARASGLD